MNTVGHHQAQAAGYAQAWQRHLLHEIYKSARPAALIAVGTQVKGSPRYKLPVPVGRHDLLDVALQGLEREVHYIGCSTLKEQAVPLASAAKYQAFTNGDAATGRIFFHAKKRAANDLCAIVLDLDVGRSDGSGVETISAEAALRAVREFVEYEVIPAPSLIAFSGRGLYLWWLLQERDGFAPESSPSNDARYKRAARRLFDAIASLCPDPSAAGVHVHWFKAPGSRTTDSNGAPTTVRFEPFDGDYEFIRRYELAELAGTSSDITHPIAVRQPRRRVRSRTASPRGPNQRTPQHCRAKEIEWLSEHRGGMRRGYRHFTLFYYAQDCYFALVSEGRTAGDAWAEMVRRVQALNDSFRPPQKPSEIRAALQFKGRRRARNHTVVSALGVTAAEVREIERIRGERVRALLPDQVRLKRQEVLATRKRANVARRLWVDSQIESGLSDSAILRAARSQGGQLVSRQFICNRRRWLGERAAAFRVGEQGCSSVTEREVTLGEPS